MLHATRCLIPVPATPQPAALPRSVDELLAAYGSPIIRPGLANIDGTITQDKLGVSFGIDAPAGLDFNEQAHRWSVYGYMRTFWQDPRLRFNATAVGPQITLNNADFMHRIWQPDLYWERVSAVSGVANDDGYGENIHIYPDGKVWRSQQRRVELSCPMDLKEYPFDTQKCEWWLGVYSEHADKLEVSWCPGRDGLESWQHACTAGWTPTAMSMESVIQRWPSGNYSYAKATLELTRSNTGEIMISYFVTSIILVILGFMGMFIDPNSMPARVGLGTIVILTTLQNYWSLLGRMPAGGDDDQNIWLLRFLYTSFYFNVICFVEQILLNFAVMAHKWAVKRETLSQSGRVAPAEEARLKAEEPVVASQQRTAPADEEETPTPTPIRMSRRRSFSESIAHVAVEAPERKMLPFLKGCGRVLPRVETWFRILLPLIYVIVVIVFLAEVNFGQTRWAKFESMGSRCEKGFRVKMAVAVAGSAA